MGNRELDRESMSLKLHLTVVRQGNIIFVGSFVLFRVPLLQFIHNIRATMFVLTLPHLQLPMIYGYGVR